MISKETPSLGFLCDLLNFDRRTLSFPLIFFVRCNWHLIKQLKANPNMHNYINVPRNLSFLYCQSQSLIRVNQSGRYFEHCFGTAHSTVTPNPTKECYGHTSRQQPINSVNVCPGSTLLILFLELLNWADRGRKGRIRLVILDSVPLM